MIRPTSEKAELTSSPHPEPVEGRRRAPRGDAVVATSRQSIEQGSKSFAAAARLFDRRTRESAWLLYAWCRHCDDVIDGQALGQGAAEPSPEEKRARLAGLYAQTRAALAGEPAADPTFAAFQRVALRHSLPGAWPLELLAGFGMDVDEARYATLEDLLVYCWRVAGVVGVMMARIMGVEDEAVLRRACDLGLAFQLTNIARDIVADAELGRVYLPADWLAEAGVEPSPAAVADPAGRVAVFAAARRLIEAAEPYYDSALEGLPALPFRSAWAIAAARGVYREIGREVLREGPRAWDTRPVVGGGRKAQRALEGGAIGVRAVTLERLRPRPPRPALWSPF